MLVLTRKKSEVIHIGENIVVKVLRTGHGTVKLGIAAPAEVRILRAELCDKDMTSLTGQSEEEEEAGDAEGPTPALQKQGPQAPAVAV